MSNGWIPVTERLPGHREFVESYDPSNYGAEFLVTIAGADKATTLFIHSPADGTMNRGIRIRLWHGCHCQKGIEDNGQ